MPHFHTDDSSDLKPGERQFNTTHWTVVLEAARPGTPIGMDAFEKLYCDYWYPLYAYVRRRGHSPHEAEDLTQDFFVSLIEEERLKGLERGRGRFRSFLLKSLQNFLATEWNRASALKRGGGHKLASLDELDAESRFLKDNAAEHPEVNFERNWALAVIENAIKTLEDELRQAGKENLRQQLRPYLQGDRGDRAYSEVAAELGQSEGAIKVAVHRLRQRYGELLRAEVARTVADEREVGDELRHLLEIIAVMGC